LKAIHGQGKSYQADGSKQALAISFKGKVAKGRDFTAKHCALFSFQTEVEKALPPFDSSNTLHKLLRAVQLSFFAEKSTAWLFIVIFITAVFRFSSVHLFIF